MPAALPIVTLATAAAAAAALQISWRVYCTFFGSHRTMDTWYMKEFTISDGYHFLL
jgi:hypothetical protein